jgi:hypothetical protein
MTKKPVNIHAYVSIILILLLVVDGFLYSTGNPSAMFHLLGGWHFLYIVLVVGLFVRIKVATNSWALVSASMLLVIVCGSALYILTEKARLRAITKLDDLACAVVGRQNISDVEIEIHPKGALDTTQCPKSIKGRENFIPTFRRADYIVKGKEHRYYRLIVQIDWPSKSRVWLKSITEDELSSIHMDQIKWADSH